MTRVLDSTVSLSDVYIRSLKITDGYAVSPDAMLSAVGGCIRSVGSITLVNTHVTNCEAHNGFAGGSAIGGAVAAENVVLLSSVVSGNTASVAENGYAGGGGVSVQNALHAKYSVISNNEVTLGMGSTGRGGGICAGTGLLYFYNSALANNHAGTGGAIASLGEIGIQESTISGNSAEMSPAIESGGSSLIVSNSTIAFNHANSDAGYGAIHLKAAGNGAVTMESTIVANNTRGVANSAADLYVQGAT